MKKNKQKYAHKNLSHFGFFASFILALFASCISLADGGYLRTTAALDEDRGYCLDVAGFGVNARPDEPLRVHSCKFGEDNIDQLFKWVDANSGQVAIPAYNRCLAASSLEAGAAILVSSCDTSDTQAWTFVPNGNLVLQANPNLCLTVGEESADAGSEILMQPGYRYRSASMEFCRERGDQYQDFRWGLDTEHQREYANGLQSGMPLAIREGIQAIHRGEGSGSEIAQTNAIYTSIERVYRATEVQTTPNLSYGPDQQHKLDIHVDTQRRGDALQPVVVYVHGGGFVRGSKESSWNVGEYFGSIGLVGVSATYRLAPEAQWPNGANDMGLMVDWLKENISDYGGDPEQIYLIGKSAGGNHVATYALRPEVLDQGYSTPAGVVLISASYDSESEAYFGPNNFTRSAKAVLGNVSRASIPVLLTVSEYDAAETMAATIALAFELTDKQGAQPRFRQLQGHNHYSPNISIGTSDRMLSDEILDFVLESSD